MRLLILRGGRWCSSLIDRIYSVPIAFLPASPVGWNGTYLQFGANIDGTEGPKGGWSAPDLSVGSHNNRLILTAAGRSMVLGIGTGTMAGGDGPIPAAELDVTASMTLERSWLSWRTPFELNFMTGSTHSWRRHLYDRLTWTKASGERLDMLWHFEEGFHRDDGWNPAGTDERQTGPIRAEIRPAH
jgi:hypothetical protein